MLARSAERLLVSRFRHYTCYPGRPTRFVGITQYVLTVLTAILFAGVRTLSCQLTVLWHGMYMEELTMPITGSNFNCATIVDRERVFPHDHVENDQRLPSRRVKVKSHVPLRPLWNCFRFYVGCSLSEHRRKESDGATNL